MTICLNIKKSCLDRKKRHTQNYATTPDTCVVLQLQRAVLLERIDRILIDTNLTGYCASMARVFLCTLLCIDFQNSKPALVEDGDCPGDLSSRSKGAEAKITPFYGHAEGESINKRWATQGASGAWRAVLKLPKRKSLEY